MTTETITVIPPESDVVQLSHMSHATWDYGIPWYSHHFIGFLAVHQDSGSWRANHLQKSLRKTERKYGPVCSLQASGNQTPVSARRVAETPRLALQAALEVVCYATNLACAGAVMHILSANMSKSLCMRYILLEFVKSILESKWCFCKI